MNMPSQANTSLLNRKATAPFTSQVDAFTSPLTVQQSLASLAYDRGNAPGVLLQKLAGEGLAYPPLPAQGHTLTRWKVLAAVAAFDLSLLKLYEGHADAIAILDEILQRSIPAGSTWGVWCAEASHAKVVSLPYSGTPPMATTMGTEFDQAADFDQTDLQQAVSLHGTKAWCSGAAHLSHALVSTVNEDGKPQLVAVALKGNKLSIESGNWHAIGMANSRSVEVIFDGALAYKVGNVNSYLNRPGFWHGGAGIAACWYGAACRLAAITLQFTNAAASLNAHTVAHLGAIDVALAAARAVLHETARFIDLNPALDAAAQCLRCRLAVEAAVEQVLQHSGKALGATAYCRNEEFARMHADLTVFIRQSHAEKDLAKLAESLQEPTHWML